MIVPDANLLLYAYDKASPRHAEAVAWLETALSGDELVGISWLSISAFVRVITNPRLPGDRFTIDEAVAIVDEWLGQPNVRCIGPGERHWAFFRRMMTAGQARGPLCTDAQLAALTMEHGGELHSADRDFARFPGLSWVNPLV